MRKHIFAFAYVGSAFIAASCGSSEGELPAPPVPASPTCDAQRHSFHQEIWAPLLSTCQGCHSPSGIASLIGNTRFVLLSDAYPNAAQANLNTLALLANNLEADGTPLILARASGKGSHTGGAIYPEGSEQYKKLQSFLQQLTSGSGCADTVAGVDPRLSAVRTLDARATFRKAAINVVGRVPTAEEDARLEQSPDQLRAALVGLLEEDGFNDRLKEIFNDAFLFLARGQALNPRQVRFNSNAFYVLRDTTTDPSNPKVLMEDYLGIYDNLLAASDDDNQRIAFLDRAGLAMWEEPLALIAHVARNNRPFTEILTADYTMVNPYSAFLYGLGPKPPAGASIDAWTPTTPQNPLHQRYSDTDVPSSGILSTAAFLTRWPTTSTNLSRRRAELVSSQFLATSILTFAQRPVNSTQLSATDNPTVNNKSCVVCHRYMDPLAGTFAGFDFGNQASYQPDKASLSGSNVTKPGFLKETSPEGKTRSMPWMARHIAADERFPYAMVLRVFEGVTGRKPLAYPVNTDDPAYPTLLSAWESQNAFLHDVAARMAQEGLNIKVAFREILLSPYFRAAQDPSLPEALAIGLGEGRLLTPEILSRKVRATLGAHWGRFRSAAPYDFLMQDYNVAYGGIHPTESPVRMTQVNTMMAAIASAMAREMGCRIPAWEFTKPPDERAVLTTARIDTVPLRQSYPNGPWEADAAGEHDIRENLAYLHWRLLGEVVSPSSPEVDIGYGLFVDAWKEHAEGSSPGSSSSSKFNNANCAGSWDLNTAASDGINSTGFAALPTAQRVTSDQFSTIYAWEAVLTYLLMDYRFIHE